MPSKPAPGWLLPASLSLNVFLAVAMVSHLYAHRPGPPPSPARMMDEMAAALPPPDAEILRQAFRRHGVGREDPGDSARAFHEGIYQALAVPVFDPDALRAVFAQGRKHREELDDALQAALVEAAGRMSMAGRKALGEWTPPGRPPPP